MTETVSEMHENKNLAKMHWLICNAIRKSQEYLTRATRRYYDKTPMQIIHDIQINFAKNN